jgi:hypothetical protein
MNRRKLAPPPQPDLAATPDPEYQQRLEADRVSALWRTRTTRKPSDLRDTPLFAQPADPGLFDGEEPQPC